MIHHHIQSPSTSLLFPPKHPFRIREFRIYKRRKVKPNINPIRNQFKCNLPFDNLLHKLSSLFPPDFLSSALAFVAGSAAATSFSLSQPNPDRRGNNQSRSDIGEWILFTSPTPFNRFVFLRCPSVSIEGNDLLEDVNEKLVKEDGHFVRLDSGSISIEERRESEKGEELEYQRVCIGTEDGGVVSLDWPANLDLKEERGLDSTLLLVPGTPQGSMDERVRGFVRDALRRGFFPIVMNPRGCAGSPLTTARLFTAADSDDISTAIQFISKSRPWTTMMGVGWGLGANMLTKYLAEVGERTPLTAATCINNPFDLEEATRSTHRIAIDKMLTSGLIDILRANKELFQGRTKGFDVERALLAKSIRDFDEALSMVSYGYEAIEDFYSKSSTRNLVGNVKIPVLFIQNDDGTVPLFSIPRSTIAENSYTSMLLCSSFPSDFSVDNRSALSWCQQLSIEWLTAVELGLLKGRHPLLKDIDITINPLAGLSLMEGKLSNKRGKGSKYLELTHMNDLNGYSLGVIKDDLDDGDASASDLFQFKQNLERDQKDGKEVQESSSVDAQLVDEEANTERGEVLQTAQVVMNMLDVTMPGTLTEEEKKKVLSAVGQGETLMKALQDAVPGDVRGKLTTSVSEILAAQGTKLKFDGILGIGPKVGSSSGVKPTFQENLGGNSTTEGLVHDNHSSDQMQNTDTSVDTTLQRDTSASAQESDIHSPEKSNSYEDKDNRESGSNNDVKESSKENPLSNLHRAETTDGGEDVTGDDYKEYQTRNVADVTTKEDIVSEKNQEMDQDSSIEQKEKFDSSTETQSPSGSPSELQIPEKKNYDNQNREDKTTQPVSDQNKIITPDANPPTFSVSQALDALTGIDDSTQMAVNSVFGVLEEVITQLGEASDNENKDKDAVKNDGTASGSKEQNITYDEEIEKQVRKDADLKCHYNKTSGTKVTDYNIESEKPGGNCMSDDKKCNDDLEGKSKMVANLQEKRDESRVELLNNKIMDSKFDLVKQATTVPLFTSVNPYGTSLYDEYSHRFYLSKIPTKSLDKDTRKALLLNYFPEEGQYKLLQGPGNIRDATDDLAAQSSVDRKIITTKPSFEKTNDDDDDIIEPSYVVLDAGKRQDHIREYETENKINTAVNKTQKMVEDKEVDVGANKMTNFMKKIMLDCLKIEVEQRLSLVNMKEMKSNLAGDFEQVANAVCSAVGLPKEYSLDLNSGDYRTLNKFGTVNGDLVVSAISAAVNETNYLKRVLPLSVIVGSSLAALREYFDVSIMNQNFEAKTSEREVRKSGESSCSDVDADLTIPLESSEQSYNRDTRSANLDDFPSESADEDVLDDSPCSQEESAEKDRKSSDAVMVGVVTAALGTSAFLVQQQELGKSSSEEEIQKKEPDKLEDLLSDKDQNNIVTSLAEKAMSVAGPIVPTKEDGEVDHERLVAMLADLGQRGGMLRLVGKAALLWGGLRGAMSLTDKLISFLRIAERPLYQRVIGFMGMVFVVWSPVVIPLLPTLVQSHMTNSSCRFVEVACIIGLYAAILILVILWGKRIREYEEPLKRYGLDLTSSEKIQEFLKGLIGGVVLILSIQFVNFSLGFVTFSWPQSLPSSSLDAVTRLKVCGEVLMLVGQAFLTATAVAFVEEVLFRSWLSEEIAADLGYHQGIILSGLAFSLLQRSPRAIPGLWLLSVSLAGLRNRGEGSLSIPIGLRAGILASSYILQTGGYLIYKPSFPLWVTGTHPFQPFSGVVGLTFSLVLAILFYPRQPTLGK